MLRPWRANAGCSTGEGALPQTCWELPHDETATNLFLSRVNVCS